MTHLALDPGYAYLAAVRRARGIPDSRARLAAEQAALAALRREVRDLPGGDVEAAAAVIFGYVAAQDCYRGAAHYGNAARHAEDALASLQLALDEDEAEAAALAWEAA